MATGAKTLDLAVLALESLDASGHDLQLAAPVCQQQRPHRRRHQVHPLRPRGLHAARHLPGLQQSSQQTDAYESSVDAQSPVWGSSVMCMWVALSQHVHDASSALTHHLQAKAAGAAQGPAQPCQQHDARHDQRRTRWVRISCSDGPPKP